MVKAIVDVGKCSGHARCVAVAPDIFVLDSDGYNDRAQNGVPPGMELVARRGARACPERAITIIEDDADNTVAVDPTSGEVKKDD